MKYCLEKIICQWESSVLAHSYLSECGPCPELFLSPCVREAPASKAREERSDGPTGASRRIGHRYAARREETLGSRCLLGREKEEEKGASPLGHPARRRRANRRPARTPGPGLLRPPRQSVGRIRPPLHAPLPLGRGPR